MLTLLLCTAGAVLAAVPSVKLNNGVMMPAMLWGSGGSTQENATSTRPAVAMAIKAGFPGIDAANHYHNQVGVALGVKDSGVARDKLQGHCYNDTLAAFAQNLVQLDTAVVDI
eukprot:gene24970-22725_t